MCGVESTIIVHIERTTQYRFVHSICQIHNNPTNITKDAHRFFTSLPPPHHEIIQLLVHTHNPVLPEWWWDWTHIIWNPVQAWIERLWHRHQCQIFQIWGQGQLSCARLISGKQLSRYQRILMTDMTWGSKLVRMKELPNDPHVPHLTPTQVLKATR